MRNLTQDLRFALRTLSRAPGYVAVVVLTLALGIGGTTAIFSLVDGVLLKPLPYPQPDRLALVFESVPKFRERYPLVPVNAGHFNRWKSEAETFESLSIFSWDEETLTGGDNARRVGVMQIDPEFFPILGVQPRLGRNFVAEENGSDAARVVIVTESFWRGELESDPAAVGRTIKLHGQPHEVVGVLPGGFRPFNPNRIGDFEGAVQEVELFRPLLILPRHFGPGEFNFNTLARLKPGISFDQADAELDVIQAAVTAASPELQGEGMALEAIVRPLSKILVGDTERGLLLALCAVGVVLLIGCVNIAIVALGRSDRRRAEFATRAALGGGRLALMRQAGAESVCLAVAGGALGVWLAYSAVAWMRTAALIDLPRADQLVVDSRVLGFAVVVTALSGILFSLIPAWRLSSANPSSALSSAGRTAGVSRRDRRFGETLAVGEVALCTTLLVVAGLLGQSLFAVLSQDRGFDASASATARVSLAPVPGQSFKKRVQTVREILDGVQSVPGVESAGIVTRLPLTQETSVRPVLAEEAPQIPPMERPMANFRWASPGYFDALQVPILSGRAFVEDDGIENPVVISRSTAEKLWPGRDPIGRRIREVDEKRPLLTVVGVAADVPISSLESGSPMLVYEPYWQRIGTSFALAVRTQGDPTGLSAQVLKSVRKVDPEAPAFALVPADQLIADATRDRRFQVLVTGLFAAVALMLACVGVYGVLSQAIGRRTREIGLCMALGAESSQVARSVLLQGMRPVALGLAAGIVGALVASNWLDSLLFGVSSTDPLSLVAAPSVLAVAALLACAIPARRAASLDPLTALRHD